MSLGPIELIVLAFPGSRFNGEIIPELDRLVASGTISIVDGLLVHKDADGEVSFLELAEAGLDADVERLAELVDQLESLISDGDVEELAATIEPGSSAAILVFEHTWVKPLRDAVVAAGGVVAADLRVPGLAVQELLDELAAAD